MPKTTVLTNYSRSNAVETNEVHIVTADASAFAHEWIAAWNSHDLDRVLSHYTNDFEIASPMIRLTTGADSGTLFGKPAIRSYWEIALAAVPNLHFELLDVATGVDSIALYYKSVMGKIAIEVMHFNHSGLIKNVVAHYR